MTPYAIISVGGKQYRVREGETLLVDRLKHGAGNTFQPTVLLIGGDGNTDLSPSAAVTARSRTSRATRSGSASTAEERLQEAHRLPRQLSEIRIESIGAAKKAAAKRSEPAPSKKQAEAPAPAADDRVKGMPSGYEELTVAQIKEQSSDWNRPMLEAALEYEQAHGKRKGALAAIESALARRRATNGAQEGPRLLPERPRLEREAAWRQDLRRPAGQAGDDHRPPARHPFPPRPGTDLGRDDTIFAVREGVVEFRTSGEKRFISVNATETA